jgi:hypothetical protein
VTRVECYEAYKVLRENKTFVTEDGWTLEQTGTAENPRAQGLRASKNGAKLDFKGPWGSETVARCLDAARGSLNREKTKIEVRKKKHFE